MLKIGDFSALSQVSIKTLRYYDETGLLPPVHVDPVNGYRYYSASQLSQLHRILALKDFGFTLEQIGKALDEGITADQMRGMLLLRQAEQQRRVEEESDRLSRLNSRIRLIEQENHMAYDVVIKPIPRQWIASVRETIPAYNAVGSLYGKVSAGFGPSMSACQFGVALWHDFELRKAMWMPRRAFILSSKCRPRMASWSTSFPKQLWPDNPQRAYCRLARSLRPAAALGG